MRAFWQRTAAAVAILAASVSTAAGQVEEDPAAAKAFLKDLVDPAPLSPQTRRRVEALLADLGSESAKVRAAASRELHRIGAKAEPLVRQVAKSPDAEVALRAGQLLEAYKAAREGSPTLLCRAVDLLAKRKDKSAIGSLVALLGHADKGIRHVAEYRLRLLTGMQFGYNAHAPEDRRRAAAAKWAGWWKRNRGTFDLAAGAKRSQAGGVLAWSYSKPDVFLVGVDGQVAWSRRLPKPFRGRIRSASALANGNVLVSTWTTGRSVLEEYDPDGRRVWQMAGVDVSGTLIGVRRLPSGNTFAIERNEGRALEIDPTGQRIVRQQPAGLASVRTAQRLPNGNTLLCSLAGGIREIDRAGQAVWTTTLLGRTLDAQKLPNGNLLIVDLSRFRVAELTVDGREVWHWTAVAPIERPVGARRLPDGRTVVQARGKNLLLIGPAGRSIQRITIPSAQFVCFRQFTLAPAGAERNRTQKPPAASPVP